MILFTSYDIKSSTGILLGLVWRKLVEKLSVCGRSTGSWPVPEIRFDQSEQRSRKVYDMIIHQIKERGQVQKRVSGSGN